MTAREPVTAAPTAGELAAHFSGCIMRARSAGFHTTAQGMADVYVWLVTGTRETPSLEAHESGRTHRTEGAHGVASAALQKTT